MNTIDALRTAKGHFEQGLALARGKHWQEAGGAFAAAWRVAPDRPQAAQGLLECAAQLARQSIVAPVSPRCDAPSASGRISFVVCSIDPQRLARLRSELDRNFQRDEFELVHIADARSLAEGYSRGLARARGDWLVFCHDDIGFLAGDFSPRLRRHLVAFDLVGVAGSDCLNGPAWHWAGPPHTASRVSLPRADGGIVCGLLGTQATVLRGAQALDGVFLAGPRATFERIGFDADTFDGFHFYDLDLSYRAHRAGLACAAALDLVIWHQSGGNFAASWQSYADRFVAKFPDLAPTRPAAPYRTGALVVESAAWVAPVYAWVEHWLESRGA
jgi:hypothetical protein